MSGEREEWTAPEPHEWRDAGGDIAEIFARFGHVEISISPIDKEYSAVAAYADAKQSRQAGLTLLRAAAHFGDEEARRVLRAADRDAAKPAPAPEPEAAAEYTAEDAAHDLTVATGERHAVRAQCIVNVQQTNHRGDAAKLRIVQGSSPSRVGQYGDRMGGWHDTLPEAVRAVVRAECPVAGTGPGCLLGGGEWAPLRCGLWVPVRDDGGTVEECDPNAELRDELAALRRVDSERLSVPREVMDHLVTHSEDLAEHRSMIRRLARQVWCLAQRCTEQLDLAARPIIDQARAVEAQAARKARGADDE